MTNIEKLIEKYGIKVIKRIPEKYSNLNYVIIYGMYINMHELIDYLKVSDHIASYRHLIGCEYKSKYNDLVWFCSEKTAIDVLEEPWRLSSALFWIDGETLGTYEEYMQLHYPEYVNVWKHQL